MPQVTAYLSGTVFTGNRTIAGSDVDWTDPANAQDADAIRARCNNPDGTTRQSSGLAVQGFDFASAIPVGATIVGIQCRVGSYLNVTGGLITTFEVCKLIRPDNSDGTGDRTSELFTWSATPNTTFTDFEDDLWGDTWTRADVLDPQFGFFVGIEMQNANDRDIDYLQIRIFYDPLNTGWKFPGTMAGNRSSTGGTLAWSNPDNAKADDGSTASVVLGTGHSLGLAATNFDFSVIPAGATIDGVEIRFGDYDSNSNNCATRDCRLILPDDSDGIDERASELPEPTTTLATNDVGGFNNHWLQGFTRADVQDVDFGFFVAIGRITANPFINVDFMQMRVFYHVGQTALPVLVQPDRGGYGNNPPHLIGDWIYTCVRILSGLNMQMQKAPVTDPGGGFMVLDSAGQPTGVSSTCWSSVVAGTDIHILNTNVGDVNEFIFDTITETWTDNGTLIVDAGADTANRSMVDLHARDDGELVACYNGETERIHGGDKERVYVMYKDGSPPTWTVGVSLDVGGDIHYGDVILTKSPNTNGMHVFWQRQTNTADPPTTWLDSQARTFRADKTLATLATGSQDTNLAMLGAVDSVSWDNTEDSPDDQMTIWIGARDISSQTDFVRFLGSQDNTDRITGIGSSISGFNDPSVRAGTLNAIMCIDSWPDESVSPPVTEDIYVLWAGGGVQGVDRDLYSAFSVDNGVTWSSPVEEIDATTINFISGRIYLREGDVVFGYLYDVLDEQWYGEKVLIAAAAAADFLPYYPRRVNTLLRM